MRTVARPILETHVSRGSTTGNPSCSTRRRRCPHKTMWQFHFDGFHARCCSWVTDPEGRPKFGPPFASDHLGLALAPRDYDGSNRLRTDASSYSYRSQSVASYLPSWLIFTARISDDYKGSPIALQIPPTDALPSIKMTRHMHVYSQPKTFAYHL